MQIVFALKAILKLPYSPGLKTRSRQPNEPVPLWWYCFQIWWELCAHGRFDGKEAKYFVLRLQQLRGRPGGHIKDNRELKILRERRPRKRRLESEFAFFQSLSRLLQLINFVKCKRTLFEPNSLEPYSNSERGRKFSCRLFTSPIKREIRHFPVVVLLWLQRNVQKSVTLLFCLFNQLLFWRFCFRRRRGILKSLLRKPLLRRSWMRSPGENTTP